MTTSYVCPRFKNKPCFQCFQQIDFYILYDLLISFHPRKGLLHPTKYWVGTVIALLTQFRNHCDEFESVVNNHRHILEIFAQRFFAHISWSVCPVAEVLQKIVEIYNDIKAYSRGPVTCVRTVYMVTIVCEYSQRYPIMFTLRANWRNIQIILRMYASPSHILTSFDIVYSPLRVYSIS